MIRKEESGVSSEKTDNQKEERYTAHSDGNKIFKGEEEKEKGQAGTTSPEEKNSVDASKNKKKIKNELIGDKINTKNEKEFNAQEIIPELKKENAELKKENAELKKENKQIKKENAELKHDLEELKVKFDNLMKVHKVMLSRLDEVERHNEILQQIADKFDIFLKVHPEFKETFGVNIESHETEAKEEKKSNK